ncbi:unnamed protein product [Boreogadus saida]
MPEFHSRLTVPLSRPAVINVILLLSLFKEGFLDRQEAHTGSIKRASGANVATLTPPLPALRNGLFSGCRVTAGEDVIAPPQRERGDT